MDDAVALIAVAEPEIATKKSPLLVSYLLNTIGASSTKKHKLGANLVCFCFWYNSHMLRALSERIIIFVFVFVFVFNPLSFSVSEECHHNQEQHRQGCGGPTRGGLEGVLDLGFDAGAATALNIRHNQCHTALA